MSFLVVDVRFGMLDGWYSGKDGALIARDSWQKVFPQCEFHVLEDTGSTGKIGDFAMCNNVGLLNYHVDELRNAIFYRIQEKRVTDRSVGERFEYCRSIASGAFDAIAHMAVSVLSLSEDDADKEALMLRAKLCEQFLGLIEELKQRH